MSDKCKDCFKHHGTENAVCEKCGKKTLSYKWSEPDVIRKCSNCGYGFVGSGFWAPCSVDETEYKIRVVSENLSNNDLVTISKAAKIPALEVKKAAEENMFFNKSYDLKTVKSIEKTLSEHGLVTEISPMPEYGEYETCRLKKE